MAKGTTKMFPMHFTNNPIFMSPQSRKKYPDKRRMLPMYRNTLDFDIRGIPTSAVIDHPCLL